MNIISEYKKYIELQKGIKVLAYFTEYIAVDGVRMLQVDCPKYGAWAHYPIRQGQAEEVVIDTIKFVIDELAQAYSKIPMGKVWSDKRTLKRNLDKLIERGYRPSE